MRILFAKSCWYLLHLKNSYMRINQHVSKIWNLSSFAWHHMYPFSLIFILQIQCYERQMKWKVWDFRWGAQIGIYLHKEHRSKFSQKSFNSLSHQCHIFFIFHVVMNCNSISLSCFAFYRILFMSFLLEHTKWYFIRSIIKFV